MFQKKTIICLALILIGTSYVFFVFWHEFAVGVSSSPLLIIQNIAVVLAAIPIFITLVGLVHSRNRKLHAQYEITWKGGSSIEPRDILSFRALPKHGFDPFYYYRKEEDDIKSRVRKCENVLVIGDPLAGKSRCIYQSLKDLGKQYDVMIPRSVDINPVDFRIPFHWHFKKRSILLLDDLDKYARRQNFTYLFDEFSKRNIIIVATCRSGPEYEFASSIMGFRMAIFGDPVRMSKVSPKEGEEIAKRTGRDLPREFDGNIGSVFLRIDDMRKRFNDCCVEEKAILRSVKRLYCAGIYDEKEFFSAEKAKLVSNKLEQTDLKDYEWTQLISDLCDKGLIQLANGTLWSEETYLENVIENDYSDVPSLMAMVSLFLSDPNALLKIGGRAYQIGVKRGNFDLVFRENMQPKYMNITIRACTKALEVYKLERFPVQYAQAQVNLAGAYNSLALPKEQPEYCRKSIKASMEALRVFTLERFPEQYAHAHACLVSDYFMLARREPQNKFSYNKKEAVSLLESAKAEEVFLKNIMKKCEQNPDLLRRYEREIAILEALINVGRQQARELSG